MSHETTCDTCGNAFLRIDSESTCPQCGASTAALDATIDLPGNDSTVRSEGSARVESKESKESKESAENGEQATTDGKGGTLPLNEATIDFSTVAAEGGADASDSAADSEVTLDGDENDIESTSWGFFGPPKEGAPAGLRQFGDYVVEREIARGGMGVVYQARQRSLNRVVALKMIRSGELAGTDEVRRFHLEAEAAAALDHPCIVPIYDVGELNDQHYYSMGFIDGKSLSEVLADGPLSPLDAAQLVALVADAMDYAHTKGVIHRDLKPGNILLVEPKSDSRSGSVSDRSAQRLASSTRAGQGGDASLNMQPRITDFGLAKQTQSDSELTSTGQVLGTPSYMPPEQARGDMEIGPAADVYSLGAVLYATLVGRPPFQSANVLETIKQVIEQDPVPPSRFNPSIPRDIDNICLKCLEKAPARRYESAAALADDLYAFVEGRPVQARPVGRGERFWRWCRRKPMAATALVTGVVTAISLVVLMLVSSQLRLAQEHTERLAKEHELTLEKSARLEQETQLRAQELKAAQERTAAQRKIAATQEYFAAISKVRERNALADMGWAYAGIEDLRHASQLPVENKDQVALRSTAVRCLTGIDAELIGEVPMPNGYRAHRVAVSPDRKRFAIATNKNRFQLYICVCDFPSGEITHELRVLPRSVLKFDGFRHLAFFDDGNTVGAVTRTGFLHRWDLTSENLDPVTVEIPFKVEQRIVFDPPRNRAYLQHDGKLFHWPDLDKPDAKEVEGEYSRVYGVSSDGKRLLARVGGSTLVVLDLEDDYRQLFSIADALVGRFDDHGRILCYTGDALELIDAESGAVLRRMDDPGSQSLHEGAFREMQVSPDGALAVSSASDQVIKIWDLASGDLLLTINVGDEDELWPQFVDSNHLVTSGRKKGLIYRLNGPGMLDSVCIFRRLHSFDVSTEPFRYVGAGTGFDSGASVDLWEAGRRVKTWGLGGGSFYPEVSVDRQLESIVVSMYEGDRVWGWKLPSTDPEAIAQHDDIVSKELTAPSLAVAMGDSCWIVEDDNELAWRDLADLSERWRWSNKLASHLYGQGTIPDVAVAQDRVVAVTKTHLVDLDFQQKKDYGTTIAEGASAVAVRREGDVAVYGTQGGELGVVPLTRSDTKPPPPIKAHGGYITSIAFAPDQQLLATSARDRTVRLWQLSGQQLEAVLTIQLPVVAPRVRFTPEGDLVALPYKHNGLRVWRLAALRKQLADMGLDWNASEPAGEPDLSPESAP